MSTETFVLPPRAKVGYLDPAIAGEGQQVLMSDGETVTWSPPPPEPTIPDWSKIKTIRKYFGRKGHVVWPAWLYHANGEQRIVRNADEAAELGICYREASENERARYGVKAVWDWKDDCQWRPEPYPKHLIFDPAKPGHGKTVIHGTPNPLVAQNSLVEALIPQVAAAVALALKSNGPSAPANIDPKAWEEFQAFLAFKKSSEVVAQLGAGPAPEIAHDDEISPEDVKAHHANALKSALDGSDDDDRANLEAEAIRIGMKIDRRWSLDRLRSEIDKAA